MDGDSPEEPSLYSEAYWRRRQKERFNYPAFEDRPRLDLPERCVHWLNLLLKRRLPPARVLELGSAHGGYVALMRWAGYEAIGTEMSPGIVEFAVQTFAVPMMAGRVEDLPLANGSFDVVILNDVIEHFPDPLSTMGHCARLLAPEGFFILQTPEYKEHLTYEELLRTGDRFLEHLRGKSDEHLYLFSRRSAARLFERLGFPVVKFENPIFDYDLFFSASRVPLLENSSEEIATALSARPTGRLVLALLDKAYESNDRWWAMQRYEERLRGQGGAS
jgi:SAM-dependent methyltransferase